MNENRLLDAVGGIDVRLLQRSEKAKAVDHRLLKILLPLAACLCLVAAVAYGGRSFQNARPVIVPENTTEQNQQDGHRWVVSYNQAESIHSADRAFPLGYFTEELDPQELDAVMPDKAYDWMVASGVAGFSGEGELINVQLQITTQDPTVPIHVVFGDDLDCWVVLSDMVLSKCGELEYAVYQYTQDPETVKLEANVSIGDVPVTFSMIPSVEQLESAKADFEAVLECFAWYEDGKPNLDAVTAKHIPEWYDKQVTVQEALDDPQFGMLWLKNVPDGFTAESIRRHKDMWNDYLSGLWTNGLNEFSWRISYLTDEDSARVTAVSETKNYDLSLYPIPRAESVPDELCQIVNDPIFSADELTLKAVQARAYTVDDMGDTNGVRMEFSVKYDDKLVSVRAKGVDPEWVYEQLKSL